MSFATHHKDPKTPLTMILVWAVALVLFWMALIDFAPAPSAKADVMENRGVQSFLLMNDQIVDDETFIEIQDQEENILPIALKKLFTFVSMNILSMQGSENTLNVPVATIGIRG